MAGKDLSLSLGFSHPVVFKDARKGSRSKRRRRPKFWSRAATSRWSARWPPRSARSVRRNPTRARVCATPAKRSSLQGSEEGLIRWIFARPFSQSKDIDSHGESGQEKNPRDCAARKSTRHRISGTAVSAADRATARVSTSIRPGVRGWRRWRGGCGVHRPEADVRNGRPHRHQEQGCGGRQGGPCDRRRRRKAAGIESVAFDRSGFKLSRAHQGSGRCRPRGWSPVLSCRPDTGCRRTLRACPYPQLQAANVP
jgi:hypothetical protein